MGTTDPCKGNIITIDGPAGAGKSTIARLVAGRLGYEYLDTGAIYRGITYFLSGRSIGPSEDENIALALEECAIFIEEGRVFIGGLDVSDKIRSPEIDQAVSAYSALPTVRSFLLQIQRMAARGRKMVAEGRDMGSVVFPEASVKFYLDASLEVRATRRWRELEAKGVDITLEEVKEQVQRRDQLDSEREFSPLRVPEDANIIDTSKRSLDEVVNLILAVIEDQRACQRRPREVNS